MYIKQHKKGQSSPTHEHLISYAKKKLIGLGYSNIELNYNIPSGILDLYGEKDNIKTGVECLVNISIRKQKRKYLKYVDSLVFCFPSNQKVQLSKTDREDNLVFWGVPMEEFPTGITNKNKLITTIRLSKETKGEMDRLKIHPNQSYNEVIEVLLGQKV